MSTERQDIAIKFQEDVLFFGVWQSCLNCHHWSENAKAKPKEPLNICNKFKVQPPLKVIVVSCPEWLPHVPF